jgi:hypothetical protein
MAPRPTRKDFEDGGERQHVVEVRHDVIGILQHAVGTGIGDHDTGEPAGN